MALFQLSCCVNVAGISTSTYGAMRFRPPVCSPGTSGRWVMGQKNDGRMFLRLKMRCRGRLFTALVHTVTHSVCAFLSLKSHLHLGSTEDYGLLGMLYLPDPLTDNVRSVYHSRRSLYLMINTCGENHFRQDSAQIHGFSRPGIQTI